ncbi:DUF2306 domain-containing protein [Sphingomonas sp. SUN039]|uniref:DUF2306 domain-containing protein n=1 Tax=Sphingomonas sp. SUN039 TaxID=2937787 RepID=UPI0021646320|nr:DUF2306 domain-containing protein [Sphingomonas sp. SUN039]UVO54944.1 DUF2306 domain-containing protein [Sphingomonas sp. SUN039]
MATIIEKPKRAPYGKPLTPDPFERVLSVGAVVLLACIVVAVAKGRAQWGMIPAMVWPHLLTIVIAVALTPVMLLRRRGDTLHRQLGWVWVVAMLATAASSFFIRDINHGGFSFIHILSLWTLFQVPLIVWSARTHNVRQHRSSVRGMVTGALLVAGFFTFPFDRLLGHWLFS